jgi:hypothetical protein
MSFVWDEKKNLKLREERGIDFETYVVPFREEQSGDVLLITIFQSRKFKKIFSEE